MKSNLLHFLCWRQYGTVKTKTTGKFIHGPSSNAAQYLAEEKGTLPTKIQACELTGQTRSTFLVTFSPDGSKVASTHGDHTVRVTDIKTGLSTHTLTGHPRTPWCIAFHPSSNDVLASACLGGEVRIWDLRGGGSEVWRSENNSVIASLTFHPIDQVVVIATGHELIFWDWTQPTPFVRCQTSRQFERVRWVKFDPCGHFLFTGIANATTVHNEEHDTVSYLDQSAESISDEERRHLRERYRNIVEQINSNHPARHWSQQQYENRSGHSVSLSSDLAQGLNTANNVRPHSPVQVEALQNARDYAAVVTHISNAISEEPGEEDSTDPTLEPTPVPFPPAQFASDPRQSYSRNSSLSTQRGQTGDSSARPDNRNQTLLSYLVTNPGASASPDDAREERHATNESRSRDLTYQMLSRSHLPSPQLNRPVDRNRNLVQPVTVLSASSVSSATRRAVYSMASSSPHVTLTNSTMGRSDERSSHLHHSFHASRRRRRSPFSDTALSGAHSQCPHQCNVCGNYRDFSSRLAPDMPVMPWRISRSTSSEPTEQNPHRLAHAVHSGLRHTLDSVRERRLDIPQTLGDLLSLQREIESVTASHLNETSAPDGAGAANSTPSSSVDNIARPTARRPFSFFRQAPRHDNTSDTGLSETTAGAGPTRNMSRIGSLSAGRIVPPSSNPTLGIARSASGIGVTDNRSLSQRIAAMESDRPVPSAFSSALDHNLDNNTHRGNSRTSVVNRRSRPIRTQGDNFGHHLNESLASSARAVPASNSNATLGDNQDDFGHHVVPSLTSLVESYIVRETVTDDLPDLSAEGASSSNREDGDVESSETPAASTSQQPPASTARVPARDDSIVAAANRLSSNLERRIRHLDRRVSDMQNRLSSRFTEVRQDRFSPLRRLRRRAMNAHYLPAHLYSRPPAAGASLTRNTTGIRDPLPEEGSSQQLEDARTEVRSRLSRLREYREDIRCTRFEMEHRLRSQERERRWQSMQRHHLHPDYSVSILDDTVNRTAYGLQAAINRAIAGAVIAGGEPSVASNIVNLTHKIQRWNFLKGDIPDIKDREANVLLRHCKLHNDASCEISNDGRLLACFVPTHGGFPDDTVLGVFSLLPDSLGQCLYTKSFGPNAISISLSPLNNYVLVGLASKRLNWVFTPKQLVAQVYKLTAPKSGEDSMEHICDLMHTCDMDIRTHVSVNSARWLPGPGEGIVYGTNRGALHLCRPGFEQHKMDGGDGSQDHSIRLNLMQMLGRNVPRTISISTQTAQRVRRTASTQTDDLEPDVQLDVSSL